MTPRPLQVLLAEDSEHDAHLVLEALHRHGFVVEHRRVMDAAGFSSALRAAPWSIVLCDYVMPGFDALAAMEIFREAALEIPLIIVSGTIGEEIAIEALKLGATDYVLKQNLARLGPAVEHAIQSVSDRKQRRRLERFARVQSEVLELLLQRLALGTLSAQLAGLIDSLLSEGSHCVLFLREDEGLQARLSMGPLFPRGLAERLRLLEKESPEPPLLAALRRSPPLPKGPVDRITPVSELQTWGLAASWSQVVMAAEGHRLGSLVVVQPHSGAPSEEDRRVVETAGKWISLAVERWRTTERLIETSQRMRRSEADARELAARLTTLVENMTDAFFTLDSQGRLTYVNPATELVWLRPRGELLDKVIWEEGRNVIGDRACQQFQHALADRETVVFEDFYPSSARWMEVRAYPSTAGLAVYLRDLTAQKRLESFKIEQAALVERIAAGAPLAEILNSAVRLIEEQYPFALCSILLLDPSGERLCHGAAPSLPPAFVQAIEGAKIGPAVGTCGTAAFLKKDVVTEDIMKDPAWGPFREAARAHGLRACWSTPIFSSDRQVLGTFAVYARTPRKPEPGERELVESGAHIVRIAIERRRSEDRVRESQRVLATLLSNLPGMAYRSHRDPPWTIEFVSKGCRELTGYLPEDLVGNRRASFESLTHPEDRERVHEEIEAALALGHSYDLTYRIITAQQQIKWVWERGTEVESEAGKPRLCEGFVTDITEKKNLEQQFFRAQRMESIGTLAGGIAHDLNNVLAPILMSVDLLKLSPHGEDEERILATIEASTKRGADMVRQVLAFARGVEGHHVPTPPRHVIGEVVNVIAETFPKSITYEVSVARDVWMIRGDPTQINQVLLNLCVNARDAMEPAGGRLLITAENVYIDEATMRLNGEGRMGPHVLIQVSDSGSGIPPEIRERIFEPFFTTKGIGRGTGLGLATVASIVRSHGGFIRLESEVGKGTSFKVYFPAQPKSELASPVAPAAPPPRGRGETILVVDDEMSVRLITRRSLESFGYRVLLAENGAVALDLYRRFRPDIAAIVTDMMMPVLDGAALIAELAQMDAGVRILAVSGITPAVGSPNVPRLDRLQFLAKPYSVEALLISLHRVLTL